MLPWGTETAMEEKRQVRTKDRWQALGEIPVPGVGSIEGGQLMQNVEFQKVEGNYNPLQERKKEQSGCPIRGMLASFPCTPLENIQEPHHPSSPFSRAKKIRVRSDYSSHGRWPAWQRSKLGWEVEQRQRSANNPSQRKGMLHSLMPGLGDKLLCLARTAIL